MRLSTQLADFTDKLRTADGSCELVGAFFISSTQEIADIWTGAGHLHAAHLPIELLVEQGRRVASSQVMLVHTHPSGDPRPSRQDLIATKRLRTCLMTHNIRMCDHIILAQNRYFSFRRGGLL
jgi:DNA repair protein RadC